LSIVKRPYKYRRKGTGKRKWRLGPRKRLRQKKGEKAVQQPSLEAHGEKKRNLTNKVAKGPVEGG